MRGSNIGRSMKNKQITLCNFQNSSLWIIFRICLRATFSEVVCEPVVGRTHSGHLFNLLKKKMQKAQTEIPSSILSISNVLH